MRIHPFPGAELNQQFQVSAGVKRGAFVPRLSKGLKVLPSVQQERSVGRDNTIVVGGKAF